MAGCQESIEKGNKKEKEVMKKIFQLENINDFGKEIREIIKMYREDKKTLFNVLKRLAYTYWNTYTNIDKISKKKEIFYNTLALGFALYGKDGIMLLAEKATEYDKKLFKFHLPTQSPIGSFILYLCARHLADEKFNQDFFNGKLNKEEVVKELLKKAFEIPSRKMDEGFVMIVFSAHRIDRRTTREIMKKHQDDIPIFLKIQMEKEKSDLFGL